MTILTIPYTLESDDGPLPAGYRPEVSLEVDTILEAFEDTEAGEIDDDEILEYLLECVRENFIDTVAPSVHNGLLADLVKKVREALQLRDSTRALTHGA